MVSPNFIIGARKEKVVKACVWVYPCVSEKMEIVPPRIGTVYYYKYKGSRDSSAKMKGTRVGWWVTSVMEHTC